MEFTVKIPYRHVSFRVKVQKENFAANYVNLNVELNRQNNIAALENNIEANRLRYFLFK
ncbi:MAG: hypothetical protein ACQESO_08300 [Bacillota bacterium]